LGEATCDPRATAGDDTRDPALRSCVKSANALATDLPIQNLPLGRFRRHGHGEWRLGVAIGDQVLDLQGAGLVGQADMNRLMAEGRPAPARAARGLERWPAPKQTAPRRVAFPARGTARGRARRSYFKGGKQGWYAGAGSPPRAMASTRRDGLRDDGLPEAGLQLVGDQAGQDVGRPAPAAALKCAGSR